MPKQIHGAMIGRRAHVMHSSPMTGEAYALPLLRPADYSAKLTHGLMCCLREARSAYDRRSLPHSSPSRECCLPYQTVV
jgi:hypothetical protein